MATFLGRPLHRRFVGRALMRGDHGGHGRHPYMCPSSARVLSGGMLGRRTSFVATTVANRRRWDPARNQARTKVGGRVRHEGHGNRLDYVLPRLSRCDIGTTIHLKTSDRDDTHEGSPSGAEGGCDHGGRIRMGLLSDTPRWDESQIELGSPATRNGQQLGIFSFVPWRALTNLTDLTSARLLEGPDGCQWIEWTNGSDTSDGLGGRTNGFPGTLGYPWEKPLTQ